jgi:hypothetical protein
LRSFLVFEKHANAVLLKYSGFLSPFICPRLYVHNHDSASDKLLKKIGSRSFICERQQQQRAKQSKAASAADRITATTLMREDRLNNAGKNL